jgi:hypothetical protein
MPENNPFYVGYYPGDRPLYNKPSGGPPPPSEPIDWSGFDSFAYEFQKDVNLPAWAKDRIIADFKSSLRATIKGDQITAARLDIYGEEAVQNIPGAFGINLSLNPADWLKDPAGQTWKTAKGWFDAAADWDDLESQKRRYLWDLVLSDHHLSPDPSVSGYSDRAEEAMRVTTERVTGQPFVRGTGASNPLSLDRHYDSAGNPIFIRDLSAANLTQSPITDASGKVIIQNVSGNVDFKNVDVYKDAKYAILDFQLQAGSFPFRENKYDEALLKMSNGLKWDLVHHNIDPANFYPDSLEVPLRFDGTALTTSAGPATFNVSTLSPDLRIKANDFVAKVDMANAVGSLNKSITDKFGASSVLDKYFVTGKVGDLAGAADKVAKYDSSGALVGGSVFDTRKAIENFTDRLSPAEYTKYEGFIQKLQGELSGLEELAGSGGYLRQLSTSAAAGSVSQGLVVDAKNKLDAITKGGLKGGGFTGGDHIVSSYQRTLLRDLEKMIKNDEGSLLQNQTYRGNTIRAILGRVSEERNYHNASDISDAVLSKRLLNTYAWSRFKNRFEIYTPSYWTVKALTKVHHFGLIIADDLIDDEKTLIIYKFGPLRWERKLNPDRMGLSTALNRFDVDFSSSGRNFSLSFFGGSHFKFAGRLGGLIESNDLSKEAVKKIFEHAWIDPEKLRDPAFFVGLSMANGGKLPFHTDKDLTDFISEFKKYKETMLTYASKFGIDLSNFDDPEFQHDLIFALHRYGTNPDNLSMTKKYIGGLERVKSALNKSQTWFLKTKVGKAAWYSFYGKRIMADKLVIGVKLVGRKVWAGVVWAAAKLGLTALIGTASGGTLAFLAPLLEKVLAFLAERVVGGTWNLIKALAKGDLGKLFESWEKSVNTLVKVSLYVVAVPLGCLLVVIMVFGANLAGSVPPVNPSGGGGLIPGSGGGGSADACAEEQVSPTNCFFVDSSYRYFRDSYDGTDSTSTGHGSNDYWNAISGIMGVSACSFAIPTSAFGGLYGPNNPGTPQSVCYGRSPSGPAYGFAIDVAPSSGNCTSVYLPVIDGVSTWTVGSPFSTRYGQGTLIQGANASNITYKLLLLHVVNVRPGQKSAGDKVADLYYWQSGSMDNSHIHVELSRSTDGATFVTRRPESYVCQ